MSDSLITDFFWPPEDVKEEVPTLEKGLEGWLIFLLGELLEELTTILSEKVLAVFASILAANFRQLQFSLKFVLS
jgi:hypothetical protein